MNTRRTQHGRSVLFLASGRQYLPAHSLRLKRLDESKQVRSQVDEGSVRVAEMLRERRRRYLEGTGQPLQEQPPLCRLITMARH
jgi:ethanolamine utilization cobalamin adenosyltransferase